MRERTANLITGAAVAGITGLGLYVGGAAGEAVHDDAYKELEANRSAVEHIQEGYLDQDLELDRIEIQLGEGCIALLRHYGPEGPLVDADEDTVVNDLITDPETPCGDSPTTVRTDARQYLDAAYAIPDAQAREARLDEEAAEIESDIQNKEEIVWGLIVGGVTGLMASVFVGLFMYVALDD